ncbi:interleukin-18 receptor accessory protein-like [Arapaima gigas]
MFREILLAAVIFNVSLAGFQKDKGVSRTYGYKALAGEKFVMQCASPYSPHLFDKSENIQRNITWFRCDGDAWGPLALDAEGVVQQGNSLKFVCVEKRHAGNYSCSNGKEELHFLLDVIPRNGTSCRDHGDGSVTVITGKGGRIRCPGVSCYAPPPAVVTWYKDDKSTVLLVDRGLKITGDVLLLKTVYLSDKAVFTCDFNYTDGITWTVRRLVDVRVEADEREIPPKILYPYKNCAEEAELGKPKVLKCKVQFVSERNRRPVIKWLVSYHNGCKEELKNGNRYEDHKGFGEETFIQTAHLQQVTMCDLSATFTCFAQNSIGNVTSTLRLTRKPEVGRHLEVIIASFVALILVAGASVVVQVYRVEILLLCRTHLPFKMSGTAGKEFDAFVSYAVSSRSEEKAGDLSGEALGLCYLPRVLEQQWGYKLCLLERDLVPGGSYAEEVVSSIQRSQTVICLLSEDYLSGSCLFELETALKRLQEDTRLRVVLVWTSRPPTHPLRLPLPRIVRAALRILPALCWSSSDSACSESRFWKALSKQVSGLRRSSSVAIPAADVSLPSEDVDNLLQTLGLIR